MNIYSVSGIMLIILYACENCSVMSNSLQPHGLYSPWNSPGQNTGVGSLSLLQWIFPTQESTRGLLHCRQIFYQLCYPGEEGDDRGWDGWMASPTQWTWIWAISESWWWTGKLSVLQSMGSQRVRHDWVTELILYPFCDFYPCNNSLR